MLHAVRSLVQLLVCLAQALLLAEIKAFPDNADRVYLPYFIYVFLPSMACGLCDCYIGFVVGGVGHCAEWGGGEGAGAGGRGRCCNLKKQHPARADV